VELSEEAEGDLRAIKDRRTRQAIERGLLRLEVEPEALQKRYPSSLFRRNVDVHAIIKHPLGR
jgi:hypothetical protein